MEMKIKTKTRFAKLWNRPGVSVVTGEFLSLSGSSLAKAFGGRLARAATRKCRLSSYRKTTAHHRIHLHYSTKETASQGITHTTVLTYSARLNGAKRQ